jgi:hypothetical protein
MKMEQTECSETLAFKLLTPWNNPEENIQHSNHSESLKSRKISLFLSRHQAKVINTCSYSKNKQQTLIKEIYMQIIQALDLQPQTYRISITGQMNIIHSQLRDFAEHDHIFGAPLTQ